MYRAGIWLFLLLAIAVGIVGLLSPRADLPRSYHHFADQRSWLGIPNFGNVVSNALFLVAGLCGLGWLFRSSSLGHAQYNTLTRAGNAPGLNMSDDADSQQHSRRAEFRLPA